VRLSLDAEFLTPLTSIESPCTWDLILTGTRTFGKFLLRITVGSESSSAEVPSLVRAIFSMSVVSPKVVKRNMAVSLNLF